MAFHKKASVLNWIVIIGVPLAFISFFLIGGAEVVIEPKGIWQLDFLSENYLVAEKQLVDLSITGKKVGIETAEELAALGGNLPGIIPSCGELKGVMFWNTKGKFCFPDIKTNVESLGKAKLNVATGKSFLQAGYDKTLFYGVAGKETITTKYANYTYDNSFSVELGYTFDEYGQLFHEATNLLAACRGKDVACISSSKPAHWNFDSCTNKEVPASGTEFSFCVESPSRTEFNVKTLEYKLALDFS